MPTHHKNSPLSLEVLAALCGAELEGDPQHLVFSVADLESATPDDVSFLANSKYAPLLAKTTAGLVCVDKVIQRPPHKNYLICENPSLIFQKIAQLFLGEAIASGFTAIHPTAVIHPEATIESEVSIAPYAVIDRGAYIGKGTQISPFVYIGAGSVIGQRCYLHAHSTVREGCQLGDRVILQPGSVIGSCGFGYTTTPQGEHLKLEQLGNVIIEDDVEIGANTTVDRARFKTTRIGKGSKLDNLIQIAHNVEIGSHNLIAAQTGIAGSAKTGRGVFMGGQVGIVGHLEITDFVMIATRGGVSKSVAEKGKYAGAPVVPLTEHNRTQVHLRKIDSYVKRIEALEKRLAQLEDEISVSS